MKTQQMPDGGAFNMYAYWIRQPIASFGVTWLVRWQFSTSSRSSAVVDDFGNLVAVPYAH